VNKYGAVLIALALATDLYQTRYIRPRLNVVETFSFILICFKGHFTEGMIHLPYVPVLCLGMLPCACFIELTSIQGSHCLLLLFLLRIRPFGLFRFRINF
jgi:hypothetical protein